MSTQTAIEARPILIVDDNRLIHEDIRKLLTGADGSGLSMSIFRR